MNLTCYIIDDESDAIELLGGYIEKTPGLEIIGTAQNPLEALQVLIGDCAPDITFVDVDMSQLSGLELAGMINAHTIVVFTTAFPQFALEAFDKEAFDYLLKPINYERFIRCIHKVHRKTGSFKQKKNFIDDFFNVKSEIKGRMVRIRLEDVIYIEGAVNYIQIYTTEEKHMTYLTVKEIEQHLPKYMFVRIHRSFIININCVKVIERAQVKLTNGVTLAMGDHYKQYFLSIMDNKLIKTDRGV